MKKIGRIFLPLFLLMYCGKCWAEPTFQGKSLSAWLDEYGAGPRNYRPSAEADDALRHIGSEAVPYLLEMLHKTNSLAEDEESVQSGAGLKVGTNSSTFTPASWFHWKAYLGFQALGPEGKSAIPDLVKIANEPSTNSSPSNTGEAPLINFWSDTKNVAMFAAQSSTYQAHGPPVSGKRVFIGFVPQPFLSDAEIAAWSLAAIGADSVPPLMEMVTNSNPQIRCRAAMALGMMGKPAEPAVPVLLNTLHDPDKNARNKAADALGCIGQQPDLVIPALIKAFDDRDVEFIAVESLGAFGGRATNAIPALLALLPHTDVGDRFHNQTREQYLIGYVAPAVNSISPEVASKAVIPLLKTRIQEASSPWIRHMTLETLGGMTNQPGSVISILLDALDSTNNFTRNTAIYRLGGFGPMAKAAVPKLVSFSTGQDTNLCRIATDALDKIDPAWRKRD
jgi:HEAT repeat protein